MFEKLYTAIEKNLVAANRGDEYVIPRLRIFFDLDGTLYDLYKVPNWLRRIEYIHEDNGTLFNEPGYNLLNQERQEHLIEILSCLTMNYQAMTGIISWLPFGIESYPIIVKRIRKTKINWIRENYPILLCNESNKIENNHCWIIPYGQPKYDIPTIGYADTIYANVEPTDAKAIIQYYNVLIDDNHENRLMWRAAGSNYFTGNGQKDFVSGLQTILNLYDTCPPLDFM